MTKVEIIGNYTLGGLEKGEIVLPDCLKKIDRVVCMTDGMGAAQAAPNTSKTYYRISRECITRLIDEYDPAPVYWKGKQYTDNESLVRDLMDAGVTKTDDTSLIYNEEVVIMADYYTPDMGPILEEITYD